MATAPADIKKKHKRKKGQGKGRLVDVNALLQVRELLGDESRQSDLLIEHLHRIQDRYGYLAANCLLYTSPSPRDRG